MAFQELIAKYKELIRKDGNTGELYKWRCIKHFKDNFNIDAPDFHEMLKSALRKRANLLFYISSSFILEASEQYPDETRQMFRSLYDEEVDLKKRIQNFQLSSNDILPKLKDVEDKSRHQQDERTISFYLALRYPEKYPLYMHVIYNFMLQCFPDEKKMKAGERFSHFNEIGHKLSDLIDKDTELQSLVINTLDESCYNGKQSMMIFQDILWRCHQKSDKSKMVKKKDEEENNFILVSPPSNTKTYLNEKRTYKGSKIDWSQKQSTAKSLGDAGENFVIEREKKELEKNGLGDKADSVCKKEDGCGYDVRSFDKSGNEIYIEVKTTTGNIDEPFYMSINEKEFLEDHPKNYFLYRLHKFKFNPSRTKCYILSAKDFMSKTNLSATNFEVSIIN